MSIKVREMAYGNIYRVAHQNGMVHILRLKKYSETHSDYPDVRWVEVLQLRGDKWVNVRQGTLHHGDMPTITPYEMNNKEALGFLQKGE